MDMKLEVIIVPVSDVDRARAFYEKVGFRLDIDFTANEKFRILQFTPPGSDASIIFGKGITADSYGRTDSLVLAVEDVVAARADLVGRGIGVSEVFHYATGPFNKTSEPPRVIGPDPQGRSYYSFASFDDPDGNGWLMQEIKQRLPGRVASQPLTAETTQILLSALKSTADAHGLHEKELGKPDPDWPQWYAAYMTKTLIDDGYRLTRISKSASAKT
ncbi:MAG TPA: VOC family protein [Xanthobacteraceae bacterium]|jgi:catechol 2,3-dioxygenase-like lactoylglutathione lyase family enzyme|nr:VOC family protein [Xanthobacteraceae bacterium]